MQTRTYFASSVPAALEVARRELGEDAMLVNSKVASAAAKAFGRLEVTFSYNAHVDAPPAPRQSPLSEIEEIRQQISALRMMAGNSTRTVPESPGEHRLCMAGFDAALAREIAGAAQDRVGHEGLAEEVMSRVPEAQFADPHPGERRILAFIGPPGRGKSTSLVKLAFRYALGRKIPVRIFSAGAQGVGDRETMARYAAILGIPFEACESLESLHLSLEGNDWKGLIMIDTPGLSPADRAETSEWARFLARRPEIDKHLVLRADARTADMLQTVERFSPLKPGHLLFTGLDEAAGYGAMLTTMIRCGLPSVFSGTGSQIPENLEEADIAALVRAVCVERVMTAAVAA
ncbi:MAG: hypothetical protein ABJC09_07200 [Terriglobia bacterium]